ncbi:RHS repeat-associated core domain-containing protein [Lewinella sp. 4G2]|uniref:RHS repeat-associated core domain-containing protein n=1 Tax=Lewinella sp. 4G2 TaxID=1803372 RepID=UPI0007E09B09|nr:RHS repeat-associated core domain-containing protein [Lewinella sp. 4G2]OAV43421.1 hypothetical protein A3850_002420 [Lewinella sp. 4G2]
MCLGVVEGGKVGVGELLYRYNGIERNEELELDLAFYRSYDATIGRWLQVDPLLEKFTALSPYNGMGNNPIYYNDPLGDDISIDVGYDDEGSINSVTINLTGKVVFNNGWRQSKQEGFVEKLNSRIQNRMSIDGDVQLSVNSNLTASDGSDVEESDHVIYMENFLDKSSVVGNARGFVNDIGGKAMYVTSTTNIIHEVGHWLGLLHPKDYPGNSGLNKDDISYNNMMHHPDDVWNGNPTSSYHRLDAIQYQMARNMYNSGSLNKGSNKYNPTAKRTRRQTNVAMYALKLGQ